MVIDTDIRTALKIIVDSMSFDFSFTAWYIIEQLCLFVLFPIFIGTTETVRTTLAAVVATTAITTTTI